VGWVNADVTIEGTFAARALPGLKVVVRGNNCRRHNARERPDFHRGALPLQLNPPTSFYFVVQTGRGNVMTVGTPS
jgi:hypothetical protein